jgi:hypothetical protein
MLAGVALLAPVALATPCSTTTLDNYIALGLTGCDLGSLNLNNFSFSVLSASGGADPIPPSAITVTPTFTDKFKLNFASAGFSVVGAQAIQYLIAYTIDPPPPVLPDMELEMFAFSPVFPGFAQVTADLCVGNPFAGSVCNPPGTPHTLVVNHNGIVFNSTAAVAFPPTFIVGVRDTIELDANGASSNFSSFENRSTLVPEPGTLLLISATALILLPRRLRLKPR